MITQAQIRKQRINLYIQKIKQINIKSIIYSLSSLQLRKLIEQSKSNIIQQSISDKKIVQQMIDIQLNITMNELSNNEKIFLKSQDITEGTYRTQITEYRKAIKSLFPVNYLNLESQYRSRHQKLKQIINQQCLSLNELENALNNIKLDKELINIREKMNQIQHKNIVIKASQIALYKMTVGKEIHSRINAKYKETQRQRQEEYKLINAEEYIKIAEKLLQSKNHHELILGLCALTGRRQMEVVKGKFEINDEYSVLFTGQVKKRKIDNTVYIIPILSASPGIIDAHKRLKIAITTAGINYKTDSNKSINNRLFTSAKTSNLKQIIFQSIYPPDISSTKLNLRAAYTRICYDTFKPNMSFRAYTAKILNHKNLDSAESYDQYNTV